MKQPSHRKTAHSTQPTPAGRLDAPPTPAQTRDVYGAAMSDESAFHDESFEDDLESEFGANDELDFENSIEDDAIASDEVWDDGAEFDYTHRYSPFDEQQSVNDALDDEWGRALDDDPMLDLFDDHRSPRDRPFELQTQLERSLIKALAAQSRATFLERMGRSLDEAIRLLGAVAPTSPANSNVERAGRTNKRPPSTKRHRSRQNGHRPQLKRELEAQSIVQCLKPLRLLIQRYGKRGLSEWDVLDDAIAWLLETSCEAALPVVAALSARLAMLPILEHHTVALAPPVRKALLNAASRAATVLHQHNALTALPGLAVSVGQHSLQRDRSLAQLPQEFYRAATRVATNPRLQQRLTAMQWTANREQAIAPDQLPTKLRLNGPIEILLRRPHGQHNGLHPH